MAPDLNSAFLSSYLSNGGVGGDPALNTFAQAIGRGDYYKQAAAPILGAQFDTSTWSPTTSFGVKAAQGFLGGLLGAYGAQQEARQIAAVNQVLPQLMADPSSVAVPEGVDLGAFEGLRAAKIQEAGVRDLKMKDLVRQMIADKEMKIFDAKLDIGKAGPIEAAKKVAELEALGPTNPDLPANKVIQKSLENIAGLRKEFNALEDVKDFSNVLQASSALSGALKDKGSVSDQELVRYAIQMIEPGLSVREGEQNAVAASQSLPEAWRGELSKALEGGTKLNDDVREGIKRLATRAYEAKKFNYMKANDYYQGLAINKYGLPQDENISYLGAAPDAGSIFGATAPIATATPEIPPGMKLQRNKITGETRLVPQ